MDIDTTDLLVAFDTEYVSDTQAAQNSETLDYDAAVMIRKGNRVLCFSFSIYHPASEQRFSGIVNLPPERRQRWTLKQFLEKAVEAMLERGVISRERLAEADDRQSCLRAVPDRRGELAGQQPSALVDVGLVDVDVGGVTAARPGSPRRPS